MYQTHNRYLYTVQLTIHDCFSYFLGARLVEQVIRNSYLINKFKKNYMILTD
jgi:hypothetical protein